MDKDLFVRIFIVKINKYWYKNAIIGDVTTIEHLEALKKSFNTV